MSTSLYDLFHDTNREGCGCLVKGHLGARADEVIDKLAMSASGPKRTSQHRHPMSAFGGKADRVLRCHNFNSRRWKASVRGFLQSLPSAQESLRGSGLSPARELETIDMAVAIFHVGINVVGINIKFFKQ